MVSLWILYSTAVALLLGLGALAGERLLLASGRATRWMWVVAVAGSLLLPSVLAWRSSSSPDTPAGEGTTAVVEAQALVEPAPPPPASSSPSLVPSPIERGLGFAWLFASAGLAVAVLLSARTLERQRRTWRHRKLAGESVWVARKLGPAVVGFVWTEVVVPQWVLGWDDESQRLLVEHEKEHERAGDPYLLLLATLAVVLVPWNPALWWQARRLRLAVEIDCDARVLRRNPSPASYGRLLLEVGRISSGTLVPVAPFSRSRSLLERRIQVLVGAVGRPPRRALRALGAAALLAPAIAVTLPAPRPPELHRLWIGPAEGIARGTSPSGSPESGDPNAHLGGRPTYTAYEVRPALLNPTELQRAIAKRVTAPGNWDIPRSAVLWAFVDVTGTVTHAGTAWSSGDRIADRVLAEAVRQTAHFSPARQDGRRVSAWIQLPISLDSPGGDEGEPTYRIPIATTPPPPPPADRDLRGAPSSGDPLSRPRLRDGELAERVSAAVSAAPGEARAEREPVLWAYVDETGLVTHTRLAASSGDRTVDLAAREAVTRARFRPAHSEGQPVATWVKLPVPLPR